MKIQIFSDLHADVRWPGFLSIGVDVVIAPFNPCLVVEVGACA